METLIGLVLLISAITALVKFNKTSSAVAQGAEVKAQVWAEEIIADAVVERQKSYAKFKEATKDCEKIISHESFMQEMTGK